MDAPQFDNTDANWALLKRTDVRRHSKKQGRQENRAPKYDAQAHWWTNHPRSRAGYFERYVSLYSGERTAAALEAEPRSVLADASPASFTFMMAEELRLHYLYLDAFDNCYRRCRNQKLPEAVAAKCADRAYGMEHCYPEAEAAAVPLDFNVPSFVATVLEGARPVVVALLREPAARLWISFWFYGQFPAKYGATNAGFGYYFGNQSAAFASCAAAHGTRRCALRCTCRALVARTRKAQAWATAMCRRKA